MKNVEYDKIYGIIEPFMNVDYMVYQLKYDSVPQLHKAALPLPPCRTCATTKGEIYDIKNDKAIWQGHCGKPLWQGHYGKPLWRGHCGKPLWQSQCGKPLWQGLCGRP
jgi:hypothetical protein